MLWAIVWQGFWLQEGIGYLSFSRCIFSKEIQSIVTETNNHWTSSKKLNWFKFDFIYIFNTSHKVQRSNKWFSAHCLSDITFEQMSESSELNQLCGELSNWFYSWFSLMTECVVLKSHLPVCLTDSLRTTLIEQFIYQLGSTSHVFFCFFSSFSQ